jgi:hypothetical protein
VKSILKLLIRNDRDEMFRKRSRTPRFSTIIIEDRLAFLMAIQFLQSYIWTYRTKNGSVKPCCIGLMAAAVLGILLQESQDLSNGVRISKRNFCRIRLGSGTLEGIMRFAYPSA